MKLNLNLLQALEKAIREKQENKGYKVYDCFLNGDDSEKLYISYEATMEEKEAREKGLRDYHRIVTNTTLEKILKGFDLSLENIPEFKTDYSQETKQGYKVLDTYSKGCDRYTILKRKNDYVVAWMYDIKSGSWSQGHYGFETIKECIDWIFTKSNIARS